MPPPLPVSATGPQRLKLTVSQRASTSQDRLARAPTVEPENASQSGSQLPTPVGIGNADEFSGFSPPLAANIGTLDREVQVRSFLKLCYAEPSLTNSEITQFVDYILRGKSIDLRHLIVASSSALMNTGRVCMASKVRKQRNAFVLKAGEELKRSSCPTCKHLAEDKSLCFHLDFVRGVYTGPAPGSGVPFDFQSSIPMVLPVDGQTEPKRYKLTRHV